MPFIMKKILFFSLLLTPFTFGYIFSDKNGPFGDYTDAPLANGNPGRNCGTLTGCHNPSVNLNASTQIKFSIKGDTQSLSTFENGKTYTVRINVNGTSLARGFQATVLNELHNAIGTVSGLSSGTKKITVNSREIVEHSAISSTGIWSFDWTAPATGSDTAIIYACGNATNNNNKSTGDDVRSNKLILSNKIPASMRNYGNQPILCYPNPVSDILYAGFTCSKMSLLGLNGEEIKSVFDTNLMEMGQLPCGFYFVELVNRNQTYIVKILKH